ncbi:MAG TPA: exopolysaccharide biosynthesis polyprenyl glycosylphosphotransferase [Streptosporangiaceae bacterium]|jgi:exopolysaccharide biosynthesis polyprenyl glycosylphosphotransferase
MTTSQPVPALAVAALPAGPPAARPALLPAGQRALLAAALPGADAAALAAAAGLCWLAAGRGWLTARPVSLAAGPGGLAVAGYAGAVLAALAGSGLHRLRICPRTCDQLGRVLAAVLAPALILVAFLPGRDAAAAAGAAAALVVTARALACAALRAARRHGRLAEPALLVGAGQVGQQLASLLREHPELGLRPQGYLDTIALASRLDLPVLGPPAALEQVVAEHGIRRVIVCFPRGRDEDMVSLLRRCRDLGADVCVVPRLHELGITAPRGCLDEVWGIPLVPLRPRPGPAARSAKRALDLAGAAVLLALAAPLLAVLGLLIWLGGAGPVLFRQARVVRQGKVAQILKLRTLAERDGSDTCWVVPTFELTRLARWLRGTHLDELPQLVNVLRGQMSLVGPRPERPYFTERFGREIPRYDDRHRVRGGLTGWAQVHGLHGDTSVRERVRLDNAYIENWSPWLDAAILAATFGSLVGLRRPARPGTR